MSEGLSICRVCNGWSPNPCTFCGHDRNCRYSVVAADPAWRYANQATRGSTDNHYETMTVEEICELGRNLFLPMPFDGPGDGLEMNHNAFLFLWAPNAFLVDVENDELSIAAQVAKNWGFTPKQVITWVKTNADGDRLAIGLGNYARNCTEHMLLCRRGSPKVARRDMPNVIFAPRTKHSEKPPESHLYIEQLTGADRFLELFARRRYSKRWICHGREAPRQSSVSPALQA